jgi:hypothetical protein
MCMLLDMLASSLLCLPFDTYFWEILTICFSDQVVMLDIAISCTLGIVSFLLGRIIL